MFFLWQETGEQKKSFTAENIQIIHPVLEGEGQNEPVNGGGSDFSFSQTFTFMSDNLKKGDVGRHGEQYKCLLYAL